MLRSKLEELLEEIRENGPTRVVIDDKGEAIPPRRAQRKKGITSDVVYIRDDGWSLGAPLCFERVARRMWSREWVAVARKPFITYTPCNDW